MTISVIKTAINMGQHVSARGPPWISPKVSRSLLPTSLTTYSTYSIIKYSIIIYLTGFGKTCLLKIRQFAHPRPILISVTKGLFISTSI